MDFARRTLRNLDHVQASAQGRKPAGEDCVYPVTQLWNSLLGLIVLPRERDLVNIPMTAMNVLLAEGWPRLTVAGPEPETLRRLVGNLRNAVAHFNVEFNTGQDHEIASATMWTLGTDERGRPIAGTRNWVGRASVEELDRLARLIADTYLRQFSTHAA